MEITGSQKLDSLPIHIHRGRMLFKGERACDGELSRGSNNKAKRGANARGRRGKRDCVKAAASFVRCAADTDLTAPV